MNMKTWVTTTSWQHFCTCRQRVC